MIETTHYALRDDPWADYDARVQAVLDEYWPGTVIESTLKVLNDKHVYSGYFNGEKIVIKSVNYSENLFATTEDYMVWINYMGETLSCASYILPGVVQSDDGELMVTMSLFAQGVAPEKVLGN